MAGRMHVPVGMRSFDGRLCNLAFDRGASTSANVDRKSLQHVGEGRAVMNGLQGGFGESPECL